VWSRGRVRSPGMLVGSNTTGGERGVSSISLPDSYPESYPRLLSCLSPDAGKNTQISLSPAHLPPSLPSQRPPLPPPQPLTSPPPPTPFQSHRPQHQHPSPNASACRAIKRASHPLRKSGLTPTMALHHLFQTAALSLPCPVLKKKKVPFPSRVTHPRRR